MPVNQRQVIVPGCGERYHGTVAGTVRVVLTHYLAFDTGTLHVATVGFEAKVAHGR